ncbi:MAG: GNAT family N-acetyltransferase [Frankiaceae bacterium]|nr:GNAT family N-acetyltransferase [Frankiaceae bacterium]
MTFDTRTLTTDDLEGVWQLLERAFGGSNPPEDRPVEFALVDPKRFYGTYDGDIPVATGGSFALTMTVPGGLRPVAGVTWIGVAPTHRRRGLLTSLKRRMLDDLHTAGEPLAALWASEGAIYQRFGYGPAAWNVSLSIPSGAAFNRPVDVGDLQLTEPDAKALAPVYDQVAARSLGWSARDETWWDYRLHDPAHNRSGASPLLSVVAGGPAGASGYALYSTKQQWEGGTSASTVIVRELVAADPATHARLWRYLLDLDLMKTVTAYFAGVDDAILHLLAEPRSAQAKLKDNLWVRLVDVPAALGQRSYATEVDVVLDVVDEVCPWNAGRWRLSAGPDGATCTGTTDAADLRVNAGDLGAAFLGGSSLVARAAAGHVVEQRAGALAAASIAFGWPGPAPYAPLVF